MNFICPLCKTEGQVRDSLIPEYGCWHRCSNCNEGVFLQRDTASDASINVIINQENTTAGFDSNQNFSKETNKNNAVHPTPENDKLRLKSTIFNNYWVLICVLGVFTVAGGALMGSMGLLIAFVISAITFVLKMKANEHNNKTNSEQKTNAFWVIGCLLIIVGLISLSNSINQDTSIDGVHNIGLINDKSNSLLISALIFITGIIFIAIAKLKVTTSVSNKKNSDYIADELEKLAELKRKGVITEEEFNLAKKKLFLL